MGKHAGEVRVASGFFWYSDCVYAADERTVAIFRNLGVALWQKTARNTNSIVYGRRAFR
jgi:hypothetical protein